MGLGMLVWIGHTAAAGPQASLHCLSCWPQRTARLLSEQVCVSPVQDEPIALDKQHSRDSTAITHSSYSLPASSYSQDPVYINGSLNYSYRGYGSLGGSLQPPASLQTGNHSNGKWLCQGHGEPTLASPLPHARAVHQGLLGSPTVGLIWMLEKRQGLLPQLPQSPVMAAPLPLLLL